MRKTRSWENVRFGDLYCNRTIPTLVLSTAPTNLDDLAHHPHGRYWRGAIRVRSFCLPERWATVIGLAQACFDPRECRRNQGFCLSNRRGGLFRQFRGLNHLFHIRRHLLNYIELDLWTQSDNYRAFNVMVRNVVERFFNFLHHIDMLNGGFFGSLFALQ